MNPIVINSPSIANCNVLQVGDDVQKLIDTGRVSWLHIDLMDGHYVPNLCFPLRVVSDVKGKYPDITTDLHIMVSDPISYVDRLADAGADYVSFHVDSTNFTIRTLDRIHARGMKAGVVINPSQPVSVIEPYADLLDMVTLMAVEPGFAGQKFMSRTLDRISVLASIRKRRALEFLINVDGAINYPNLEPSIRRGANVIVTGIFTIFQQEDGFEGACRRFDETVDHAFSQGFIGDAY
ncbi:MAG: ribulose-phosphate 3-epimerase [Spirochaetales bacterium]|nr:ribulose-phosphate 3-epimerase [Spirochaetales bacterium]